MIHCFFLSLKETQDHYNTDSSHFLDLCSGYVLRLALRSKTKTRPFRFWLKCRDSRAGNTGYTINIPSMLHLCSDARNGLGIMKERLCIYFWYYSRKHVIANTEIHYSRLLYFSGVLGILVLGTTNGSL